MSQAAHKVAIVSDSASDIPPQLAKELGITIVPIIVSFNEESFKVGEEISMDEFWKRLTAPGAPFPKTAAPSAAAFTAAYDRAFAEGAQEIVSVHVASKLSASKETMIGTIVMPSSLASCGGMSDALSETIATLCAA